MKKYFEVVQGTKEFNTVDQIFNWSRPFYDEDKTKELNELLGFNIEKILGITDHALYLVEVPEDKRNQFKTNTVNGFFMAKKNSDLNKKFLAFIKKHNIRRVSTFEFSCYFPMNTIEHYHKLFDRYFISTRDNVTEKQLEEFTKQPFMKEISEIEFLRTKADYIEQTGQVRRNKPCYK